MTGPLDAEDQISRTISPPGSLTFPNRFNKHSSINPDQGVQGSWRLMALTVELVDHDASAG